MVYHYPGYSIQELGSSRKRQYQGASFDTFTCDTDAFAFIGSVLKKYSPERLHEYYEHCQRLETPPYEKVSDFCKGIFDENPQRYAYYVKDSAVRHILRWAGQFPIDVRSVVLRETAFLLRRFFLPASVASKQIAALLKELIIYGGHPFSPSFLCKVNYLDIQKNKGSQKDILKLIEDVLAAEHAIDIKKCGGSNVYFYVDDCVFTGNRVRNDLVPWINDVAAPGDRLEIFHLAIHRAGWEYAKKHIVAAAKSKGVSVNWSWILEFDNRKTSDSLFEMLWPQHTQYADVVAEYWQRTGQAELDLGAYCRPRGSPATENLCSSPERRTIYERALLEAGSRIVVAAKNPAPSMRPLGYEKLVSLGFGSVFVSYRNISNNCPLALWYGNPSYPQGHPLGAWYPLIPRRVNKEASVVAKLLWE